MPAGPPRQTLAHDELLSKLRVVPDARAVTG
jgi:hypothetical protein